MKKYILVLSLMFAFSSYANERGIVANGSPTSGNGCGDSCSWTLYDDGSFEIIGSGAMYNYDQKPSNIANTVWVVDGSPWDDYIGQITSVKISSGITSVGASAFKGATSLGGHIDIPDTVNTIGNGAFMACHMQSIKLPDSLNAIQDWAFSETTFSEIDIPQNVKTIGTGAFWNTKIETLILPDSIEYLGTNAFWNSSLKNIVISDSLNHIESDAFNEAQYLQNIYCTGDIDVCKANVGDALADKVQAVSIKEMNGMTYAVDRRGKVVASSGNRTEKRIYTIDEANTVAGPINRVSIKYR